MLSMIASSKQDVGNDSIRYLVYVNGRWRWRPTKTMRGHGFRMVNLGPGSYVNGVRSPSADDQAKAIALNAEWDLARRGLPRPHPKAYADHTVGFAYERAMKLRLAELLARGVRWTKEQESRDDGPRAWKHLKPFFADVDPRTIEPEMFLSIDPDTKEARGIIPRIERSTSISERHRAIKVWRALWQRMAAMKMCDAAADPTFNFTNPAPAPRAATWSDHEAKRLVQRAWRHGYGSRPCWRCRGIRSSLPSTSGRGHRRNSA
jgi:hypothetical protein